MSLLLLPPPHHPSILTLCHTNSVVTPHQIPLQANPSDYDSHLVLDLDLDPGDTVYYVGRAHTDANADVDANTGRSVTVDSAAGCRFAVATCVFDHDRASA